MLRLTIKTEDQSHDVDIPQSWTDVTWRQAIQWFDYATKRFDPATAPIEAISIITGLPRDFWRKYKDVKQYNVLASGIFSWLANPNSIQKEIEALADKYKGKVSYDGQVYKLPTDMMDVEVGFYEDCRTLVEPLFYQAKLHTEGSPDFSMGDFLKDTGTLFQLGLSYVIKGTHIYGDALTLDISECPYHIVIAWRDFFLRQTLLLSNGTNPN